MKQRCKHIWQVEEKPEPGSHYCKAVCKLCGDRAKFLAYLKPGGAGYAPAFLSNNYVIKKPRKEMVVQCR